MSGRSESERVSPAVPLPALAVALSAVPARTWLGYTIASFDPIYGYPPEVGTVLRWLPALIVAAVLTLCGVRPLSRLVVWAVGLFALWMLPAVFTALNYALGMRVLDGDVGEMAQSAAQVFPMALEVEVLPVVVALMIAVVGIVVRWRSTTSPFVERAERVETTRSPGRPTPARRGSSTRARASCSTRASTSAAAWIAASCPRKSELEPGTRTGRCTRPSTSTP